MHQPHPPPNPPKPGGPTVVLGGTTFGTWMPRRHSDADRPRIEVYDDRIHVPESASSAREWLKVNGNLITVTRLRGVDHLYIGSDSDAPLELDGFDTAQVRAAMLAHGWSWEGQGRVTEPAPIAQYHRVPSQGQARPEVELVLKAPTSKLDGGAVIRRMRLWLPIVMVAVFAAMLVLSRWFGIDTGRAIMFGTIGIVVAGIVAYTVRYIKSMALTVTISRERVVVRRGSSVEFAERGRLTGPGTMDSFYVYFKVGDGRNDQVAVPARIRREELLAQLNAYGWPLEHK